MFQFSRELNKLHLPKKLLNLLFFKQTFWAGRKRASWQRSKPYFRVLVSAQSLYLTPVTCNKWNIFELIWQSSLTSNYSLNTVFSFRHCNAFLGWICVNRFFAQTLWWMSVPVSIQLSTSARSLTLSHHTLRECYLYLYISFQYYLLNPLTPSSNL